MNPKPSRAMPDGAPPLVLVKRASFRPSPRLLADAMQRAERDAHEHAEAVRMRAETLPHLGDDPVEVTAMLAQALERQGGDRSDADFDVACVMLRAGDRPEHVAAMLMASSEKAHERETRQTGAGARYAERTVEAAMRAVGVKPRQMEGAR